MAQISPNYFQKKVTNLKQKKNLLPIFQTIYSVRSNNLNLKYKALH